MTYFRGKQFSSDSFSDTKKPRSMVVDNVKLNVSGNVQHFQLTIELCIMIKLGIRPKWFTFGMACDQIDSSFFGLTVNSTNSAISS